jgi:tetratricopeptide (TPR) repeat protein
MKNFLALLALALLCAAPRAVRAENKEVARQAYDEGRRRYDLNEFASALEAFKRAYLNYEDPAFLFNIAQCQRQLGKKEDAIRFYRSYLRNKPDAPNRDEIKAIVAKLESDLAAENERQAAAHTAQREAPPSRSVVTPISAPPATNVLTATAPPPKRQPVYKEWWLWTIVGVAAAGAATGVALAVTSQRTEGSLMPLTVSR